MAQGLEVQTGAADLVADYDAICRAVELCTAGEATGDVGKLGEAFHADARMFGAIAGTRYDVPIAAVATVAEDGYWGTVSFVDYLLLARIDGAWKIVCKLFAHTGGAPPEGI
jgi:hypothetical protein